MSQVTSTAQGATTTKKRGRPPLNNKDPKEVIARIARKAINANLQAAEAIKRTMKKK